MSDVYDLLPRLTEAQRRLVQDNLGLIGVHLHRYGLGIVEPTRERERDDLFQEGCLGLIQAAIQFDVSRKIPFAAYALPRIHNAVTRALHRRFSCVYVPPRRKKPGGESAVIEDAATRPASRAKVYALTEEQASYLTSRCQSSSPERSGETIGSRLRGKYDRAVREAAYALSKKATRRGDRQALVAALVDQRYRMPDESRRTPMRQIARQTHSSYARVADCDRQIKRRIRGKLEADPEFKALVRRKQAAPDGAELPIDEPMEGELRRTCAEEFLRRYQDAPVCERACLLATFLEVSRPHLDEIIRIGVAALSPDRREELLCAPILPASPRNAKRGHSNRR